MIPAIDVPVCSGATAANNNNSNNTDDDHDSNNKHHERRWDCRAEPARRPKSAAAQASRQRETAEDDEGTTCEADEWSDYGFATRLAVKSVIVHKLESGYGLRLEGQTPVRVEHVHEGGAAWRAGVRPGDILSKVNGQPVSRMSHRDVVLRFKSSSRFVGLTLLTEVSGPTGGSQRCFRRASIANGAAASRQVAVGGGDERSPSLQHRRRSSGRLSVGGGPCASRHLLDAGFLQLQPRLANSLAGQRQGPSPQQAAATAGAGAYHEIGGFLAPPEAGGGPRRSESVGLQAARQAHCINCRQPLNSSGQATSPLACFNCQLLFALPKVQQQQQQQQQLAASNQPPVHGAGAPEQTGAEPAPGHLKMSHSAHNLARQLQQQHQQPSHLKSPLGPTTNKRLEVIKEFIDTEKAHTDRLKLLDELFYKPLKEGALVSNEQLRSVFSCHRTLFKIHRQIHRTLLSASYNLCAEPMIGQALLEIFEGELRRRLERAASSFCATQSTNVQLLNKLTRRDTKVGDFIAHVASQQMVGRLGIKDLLASCFQRLTKYPLLLENLLKATPQEPPATSTTRPPEASEQQQQQQPPPPPLSEFERSSRRMLAIGLAEEREFIGRALDQSRQILLKVNESVKQAVAHKRLQELWKRTDRYPGVPHIDISQQHIVHEGQLSLKLSRRTFDVYVLLLTDYLVILLREGQDKYRLKFFSPESRLTSASQGSTVYSPVFVVDEHLSTRDAATDENGFYLLCKRKDDSRIYEFISRSPADRLKWRDRIQWTIEHQQSSSRRPSVASNITKSSSEISNKQQEQQAIAEPPTPAIPAPSSINHQEPPVGASSASAAADEAPTEQPAEDDELGRVEGTISYVEDDGLVLPSKMESSRALVDQAVQLSIFGPAAPLVRAIL